VGLLAGKFVDGTGWVAEEVGKAIDKVGQEIDKLGKVMNAKKPLTVTQPT
jgi:hypothetical protein